jgi:hypothetical protein
MRAINLEKLLPEDLPAGERVLWSGRPEWKSLARRAFRVDIVAAYFALAAAWHFLAATQESGMEAGAGAAGKTLLAGVAAVGILGLLAFASSRTTLYVITSRRVVMKIGIALQVFFNLPFSQIEAASLAVHSDGTGDIPLALEKRQRIAYLHLWPHARPFRFAQPEPALRCVPDAKAAAEILARALIAAAHERREAEAVTETSEFMPMHPQAAVAA